MNLKLISAILVITAVPVCAQAQPPSAAKVTKADAQKVLKIISDDKAKTQTYCDIIKLGDEAEKADEKKADELFQKMDELAKKLGPEYVALMDGLQDINPNSQVGQEIGSVLGALDKLCAK
jgi:predicted transcriptional regulator